MVKIMQQLRHSKKKVILKERLKNMSRKHNIYPYKESNHSAKSSIQTVISSEEDQEVSQYLDFEMPR